MLLLLLLNLLTLTKAVVADDPSLSVELLDNNSVVPDSITEANRNKIKHYQRYKPNWNDLDKRVLPVWYDQAKIGIFVHWGVYSVPSYESEWFWINWKNGQEKIKKFMQKNYRPDFAYQEFASQFHAEFFDPDQWAELFAKSGAKYVVLTSKHHEGFAMFPSKQSFSWNSVDIGPKRDIVLELSKAVRKLNLKFGVYYSLFEWFNPLYLSDKKSNFTKFTYVKNKMWPDLAQLVGQYRPSVIWSDGDWEAKDSYWKSKEFLSWLYSDSPVKDEVVVNDRWGIGIPGKHGDVFNYADRFNNRTLMPHKWENAFTIDKKSWGYRRNIDISQVLTAAEIIEQVVTTVSCGGNVLINVGPTKEGTICPIFQERLLALGKWLTINGEAIYNTSPWYYQKDESNNKVWYTCLKTIYNPLHPTAVPSSEDDVHAIYAIFLEWPTDNVLKLHDVTSYLYSGSYHVTLLGQGDLLQWQIKKGITEITLPKQDASGSTTAWTLKIMKEKKTITDVNSSKITVIL